LHAARSSGLSSGKIRIKNGSTNQAALGANRYLDPDVICVIAFDWVTVQVPLSGNIIA